MGASVYVARFLGVDTAMITPATVGTIVGGDTALDIADGDTSYVVVRRGGVIIPVHEAMPLRWERVSGPAPNPASVTSITVDAQARKDPDDDGDPGDFVGAALQATDGTGAQTSTWFVNTSPAYTTLTRTLDPYFTTSITNPAVVWRISPLSPGFVGTMAMRVTYLRATVESEGAHPMRVMQRGDGLGMGSGRVYSTGTRQGSSRVYGTY